MKCSQQSSHFVVCLLFGANHGPIRESPKPTKRETEKLVTAKIYVDEKQIKLEFNSMRMFLTAKAVFLVILYVSVLYDTFFIKTSLHRCDASIDCYILDNNYNDYPIENCSETFDNPNVTAICYRIVFDQAAAAAEAGGLLTFFTIALTVSSSIIIALYRTGVPSIVYLFMSKNSDKDVVKKNLYKTVYVLQWIIAVIVLGIFLIFRIHIETITEKTSFKRFVDFLGYLSFSLYLFFSLIIPWNLLVDQWPWFKYEKEDTTADPENNKHIFITFEGTLTERIQRNRDLPQQSTSDISGDTTSADSVRAHLQQASNGDITIVIPYYPYEIPSQGTLTQRANECSSHPLESTV